MKSIIVTVIVGVSAGYLSGLIWKGRGFGFIGNLLLGICGAFIGGFLFNLVGFHINGLIAQIISALAGALLLLWIISRIK
ncbi:MAG TPA: GlsB/YeaQ/YmgE family stress response membrane protein [Spirochaetota bacterium]|nr:GlsB/YeaQ/YmgE family stress response membrane protein [Spirochaetota bacterium]HPS86008.1 GlsB/YeaQ/YmgE family stress response membrane protein [Spirochaetota bacterium]